MASEEMQEKVESVLAEMRQRKEMLAKAMQYSQMCYATAQMEGKVEILDEFIDRLATAWKREQELWQVLTDTAQKLLEHEKTEANRRVEEAACCHQTEGGNSVVLRRALEIIKEASYVNGEGFPRIDCTIVPDLEGLIDAALSAPMRNCDRFSTFDEAWDCWFNLPSEEIGGDYGIHHFVEWLFSPVTKEVEAENV